MRVVFCGVRGSTPAAGAEFDRYGGDTSCVALAHEGESPSLLLDAGTGLKMVTRILGDSPFVGSVLLTHLHWDHWQGMPFFAAGFRPGASVHVSGPRQDGEPREALSGMMRPPYFPIGFDQLGPGWSFAWRDEGAGQLEGFSVVAREIPHKGGRCFGYRVTDGAVTVAYVTDHGPVSLGPGDEGYGPLHPAALELAAGADLLIHDAQHVAAEFPALAGLGHSVVEYAVDLAVESGARRLVLFHHDPSRTDDEIDTIVASQVGAGIPVEGAMQGRTYDLGTTADHPQPAFLPG